MNSKNFFRKKSIAALKKEASSSSGLVRNLGPFQLIILGIGAIIGGGVFFCTGFAAYEHTGSAIIISFALSGIICLCAGLCYAEFASMIPVSGSSYTYTYATLGEFPAWLVGCSVIIAYFFAAASVASGWSSYFIGLLGHYAITFPEKFIHVTGYKIINASGEVEFALFNAPSFCICVLTMLVLYRGTQESTILNNIVVFIKMTVLASFVLIGMTKIDVINWIPMIPKNTGTYGEYGISGIIAGVSIVFLAYTGFDSICTAAQETKNPQKNLPIGIIGAIVVATITYILVAAVLTGIVNYKQLNTPQPIALAVSKMDMPMFLIFVKVGAVAAITSVILVHQYSITRMIYAITEDGLLPSIFKKIHKKYHTPYIATILVGLLMGIVGSTVQLEKILKLSTFFMLLTIVVVCFGTIYLRYTQPTLHRSFRCPLVPWMPLAAILLTGWILYSYSGMIVLYAIMFLFVPTIYYVLYGQNKSKLER
jgi:APA family basic amino acid/polyamine antiporter